MTIDLIDKSPTTLPNPYQSVATGIWTFNPQISSSSWLSGYNFGNGLLHFGTAAICAWANGREWGWILHLQGLGRRWPIWICKRRRCSQPPWGAWPGSAWCIRPCNRIPPGHKLGQCLRWWWAAGVSHPYEALAPAHRREWWASISGTTTQHTKLS